MRQERGFTVLEVAIAMSVITVLLTAAMTGVRVHQVTVAREMRRLEASRAASSRIEVLRAGRADLTIGRTTFTPSMKGAEGTQHVEEIEPGLLEVEVVVVHESAHVRVALHTLLSKGTEP